MGHPVVAIVGRPNVGKSTLFNRLVGEPLAIVEDLPGTTRDRLYADADWTGHSFLLVDTGGMEPVPQDEIAAHVLGQAQVAIEEADVVVFVADVREGLTETDREVGERLRRAGKPVILVANKADNPRRQLEALEFYELGLGEPLPVSALHGTGTGDLLDAIVEALPRPTEVAAVPEEISVAIVGRPNVGKSALLNAILGQERVIVSPIPGTTRDAIDTRFQWSEQPFVLIDTAGIRRRGRIEVGVEKYSVIRSLRAIGRADVAALVIDAADGLTAQDAHIAGYVLEAYKGLVLVVNKWDLVKPTGRTMPDYARAVQQELRFASWIPIVFTSAKFGQRVSQVLPAVLRAAEERRKRIPTGEINRVVEAAVATHAPPSEHGRRLKIYYVTQTDIRPPTFVFFVNDAKLLHFSYERFLENKLREQFGFAGTPIRLVFRARGEG